MKLWHCYLLKSITNNKTYIGSSIDVQRRLKQHNNNKGAKFTRGNEWELLITVSNFENKNQCLSFESMWKKVPSKRSNKRLINKKYTNDNIINKCLDLHSLLNFSKLENNKFKYPFIERNDSYELEIIIYDLNYECYL